MEIKLADNAGFCFGVRRAIQIALEASQGKHKKIYTIGPIIHNPQMVEKLRQSGISVLKDIEDLKEGDTVIIRSHGVTYDIFEKLVRKEINIIDATCPFVKTAQNHARELDEEGYKVVVVGEKNHPEVIGIVSFAKKGAIIVNHEDKLDDLFKFKRIGIVAQTTTRHEYLDKVVCGLLPKVKELRIFNTICDATVERQVSADNLAKKVDLMIVIGSKNSANTRRLFEICKKENPDTLWIETVKDLARIPENITTIGITAGASTPDWIIEKVIGKISKIKV